MSRADRNTETKKSEVYLRDFAVSFVKNPVTGNLATLTNEADAKAMIRAAILIGRGEVPFRPKVGSRVAHLLFEPDDEVTRNLIEETVVETIKANCSGFCKLLDVKVSDGADANEVKITITFAMLNTGKEATVDVILKRVR